MAGGQTGEDEFAHFQIKTADHVDVVRQALFLTVHGPVTHFEPLPHEIFRERRHDATVDAEGAADVVDHHAAVGEFFGFRKIADRADIVGLDHVVGRLHVDRGLVVKTFEVSAGLREIDILDAFAGVAFGLFERTVRALARGLVVDDAALDDAAGGALATTDDRELAAGILADEDGDFGGADFNGADELGTGATVSIWAENWGKKLNVAAGRAGTGAAAPLAGGRTEG